MDKEQFETIMKFLDLINTNVVYCFVTIIILLIIITLAVVF